MVAWNDIEKLAARIGREFQPEQIVVFGSHAYGDPSGDSDVDLLVVLEHDGKSWQVAARILDRVAPPFPVDLLVRSPRQIAERLALGDPFLREVLERGRVVHEAHHG